MYFYLVNEVDLYSAETLFRHFTAIAPQTKLSWIPEGITKTQNLYMISRSLAPGSLSDTSFVQKRVICNMKEKI